MKPSSTRRTNGKGSSPAATRRAARPSEIASIIAKCWDGCIDREVALRDPWRDAWLERWFPQDDSILADELHCRLARRLNAQGHPGAVVMGGQHWLTLGAIAETFAHDRGHLRVLRCWASDLFVNRGAVGQRSPRMKRRAAGWRRATHVVGFDRGVPFELSEMIASAMFLGLGGLVGDLLGGLSRKLATAIREETAKLPDDSVTTVVTLPVPHTRRRAA